jgi:ABC-type oligopeptide transport system ATPase subunit
MRSAPAWTAWRGAIAQLVFQDPIPRSTRARPSGHARDAASPAWRRPTAEIDARVADDAGAGRPAAEHARRYPHEFSGGQRQRIGIARALILQPKVVSATSRCRARRLDPGADHQSAARAQGRLGLSYIMISHDLGVVEHVSDRVAVMYLGRVVETGRWETIFTRPRHPYTRALIAAIPTPSDGRGASRSRARSQSARSADRVQLPPALSRGRGHLPGAAVPRLEASARTISCAAGGRPSLPPDGFVGALNPLLSFGVVP